MAKDTPIQWCDSSLNLQAGCDGCELWNKRVRICYAGRQTEGRAGFKGWPKSFAEPELFLDRLAPALKWADLSGTARPEKPWLDKLPRIIFLNDMGDTFSAKLPANWMAPLLPLLAKSPHQFLLLTKRPSQLLEFSRRFPLPANVWPGTTVTSDRTSARASLIAQIASGGPKFVSCEPLWTGLPAKTFEGIQWAIFGGESGERIQEQTYRENVDATPCDMRWILQGMIDAHTAGAAVFVKQLGTNPYFTPIHEPAPSIVTDERTYLNLAHSHGGEWNQWPMAVRVRQMPLIHFSNQPTLI